MSIRGLYRTRDALLGAGVRVAWTAGDAAPVVSETVYEAMKGCPALSELPTAEQFYARGTGYRKDLLELS